MSDFTIRQARKGDAADLAILDNIGSHGLSLWYWQGAVMIGKAEDALDWGRARMMDNEAPFGWKNAVVAEAEGAVLGGVTSYRMPDIADGDKSADKVMAPMMELFAMAAGDWMIDNLAVFEGARGKGVGGKLLDYTFGLAKNADVRQISLIAADDNEPALALYRSRGFAQRDRRDTVRWNDSVETKYWLLLTAGIT